MIPRFASAEIFSASFSIHEPDDFVRPECRNPGCYFSVIVIKFSDKMTRTYKSGHFNISQEEEERLSNLFDRLDVNRDGKIDVKDLTLALHQMEVPKHDGHTRVNSSQKI